MKGVVVFFLLLPLVSLWKADAAPGGQQTGPGRTVVQLAYYAQPGKEPDVLENRQRASAVLASNGVTPGRVMTKVASPRATRNADDPDVVWEAEFPDPAALRRYEQIADANPEFVAARTRMSALTRKTERRYFEVR